MSSQSSQLTAYQTAFRTVLQEYQDFFPSTQRLQSKLTDDAAELGSQEGWDIATVHGVAAWVQDTQTIFRFLKRNDFDEEKTYPRLLDALLTRAQRGLHQPIPAILPYSSESLFRILPLPEHTDIVNRPIVLLRPRDVRRSEDGLDSLVEWVWWCCEMLRRCLADYWEGERWGRKGKRYGGEGCVMIVDAAGAGYKNLEIELIPALSKVASRNFPGMLQSIFVVNAGWTQRSLWGMIKGVIPRSATDRIKFIEKPADLAEYFDLAELPISIGGTHPYTLDEVNPILQYYSQHCIGAPIPSSAHLPHTTESHLPTRVSSFASTAEVFYTAQNTPAVSRLPSQLDLEDFSNHLQKNKSKPSNLSHLALSAISDATISSSSSTPTGGSPPIQYPSGTSSFTHSPRPVITALNSPTSTASTISTTTSPEVFAPIQRIRSLANFKLYLSPSRLAQVNLLADSDNEVRPPSIQRRRTLRPVILEPNGLGALAASKSRSYVGLLGAPGDEGKDNARYYSDRLVRHHAEELQKFGPLAMSLASTSNGRDADPPPVQITKLGGTAHDQAAAPAPAQIASLSQTKSDTYSAESGAHLISALSRSTNPYYGYPALRLPNSIHSIQPLHAHRRKRDLAKTLLFLFILRLQTLRDGFERFFGLNRLLPWADLHTRYVKAKDPAEGLKRVEDPKSGVVVKRTWESDWIWMIVGLVLVRGGWSRLLAWPFEVMSLDGIRAVLGLG